VTLDWTEVFVVFIMAIGTQGVVYVWVKAIFGLAVCQTCPRLYFYPGWNNKNDKTPWRDFIRCRYCRIAYEIQKAAGLIDERQEEILDQAQQQADAFVKRQLAYVDQIIRELDKKIKELP